MKRQDYISWDEYFMGVPCLRLSEVRILTHRLELALSILTM